MFIISDVSCWSYPIQCENDLHASLFCWYQRSIQWLCILLYWMFDFTSIASSQNKTSFCRFIDTILLVPRCHAFLLHFYVFCLFLETLLLCSSAFRDQCKQCWCKSLFTSLRWCSPPDCAWSSPPVNAGVRPQIAPGVRPQIASGVRHR